MRQLPLGRPNSPKRCRMPRRSSQFTTRSTTAGRRHSWWTRPWSRWATKSMSLWYFGYPDRAHQRGLAALSMDRAVAHPFSLSWVLWKRSACAFCESPNSPPREPKRIWRSQGSRASRSIARLPRCSRFGARLRPRVGVKRTIEAFRNAQSEAMTLGFSRRSAHFRNLMQCLQKKGHAEGALAALEEAVVQIDSTGYNVWEPEVYRSMGDLLLQLNSSASAKAEVSYRRAIERARSQEAKSWELRAATSLARYGEPGQTPSPYELLGPIYRGSPKASTPGIWWTRRLCWTSWGHERPAGAVQFDAELLRVQSRARGLQHSCTGLLTELQPVRKREGEDYLLMLDIERWRPITARHDRTTQRLHRRDRHQICDLLMDGLSMRSICQADDMPHRTTVVRWLERYPEFASM